MYMCAAGRRAGVLHVAGGGGGGDGAAGAGRRPVAALGERGVRVAVQTADEHDGHVVAAEPAHVTVLREAARQQLLADLKRDRPVWGGARRGVKRISTKLSDRSLTKTVFERYELRLRRI